MKPESSTDSRSAGRGALLTGGLAAVLASVCCLGPLALAMLGISGAWVSSLTLLEPYRPFFIGAAVVALYFAYQRIWRPTADCTPGQSCALSPVNRSYKRVFWVAVALLILALGFPLIAPWFY